MRIDLFLHQCSERPCCGEMASADRVALGISELLHQQNRQYDLGQRDTNDECEDGIGQRNAAQ